MENRENSILRKSQEEVYHIFHSTITYLFSFFSTPKPPIFGGLKAVINKQTPKNGKTTP